LRARNGFARPQRRIARAYVGGWTRRRDRIYLYQMPTTKTVSIYEAKARFSELMKLVAEGEGVIITRAARPVAKISPLEKPKGRDRVPGRARDFSPKRKSTSCSRLYLLTFNGTSMAKATMTTHALRTSRCPIIIKTV
jgi:prevent-host-death family protein